MGNVSQRPETPWLQICICEFNQFVTLPAAQRKLFKSSGSIPHIVDSAESTTIIENELYRITFSNRGGEVTSWILKRFKTDDGRPLDIVHTQAAEKFGYPLSLYTYDAALTASLNKALYVPSATGNLAAPAKLTFIYSDGFTQVRKTFSFDETYVLHADVVVMRNGVTIRSLVN